MMMTDVSFGAFSNHLANRLPLSISGLEVELGAPLNSSNFKGRVEGCAHTLITDIAVRKAIVTPKDRFRISSLRFRVGFRVHVDHLFHRDLRVDLRGGKAGVAQQFLDVAEVGTRVQKMCREGVPQAVR
jgi:hypothetical protein